MCKICKNCEVEIPENRIYCSLTCTNIFVNKNLRDYTKCSETQSKKFQDKYHKNPKKCKTCGSNIPYDKKDGSFCNDECFKKNINKNRKGIKYNLTIDGLNAIRNGNNKMFKKLNPNFISKEEYDLTPKKCLYCENNIPHEKKRRKYCSKKCSSACKVSETLKNKTPLQQYRFKCRFLFNVYDYPSYFNIELINKFGWYSPTNKKNNLDGVSKDHIFSIKDGFLLNVPSEIISHPANCQLILQRANSKKFSNSAITLEELKNKIIEWDNLYGTVA